MPYFSLLSKIKVTATLTLLHLLLFPGIVFPKGTNGKILKQTFNSYTTNQDGDWNDSNTWLGGIVPAANASVTLQNNITVSSDPINMPADVLITSSGSLTIDGSANLLGAGLIIQNSLNNNGKILMNNNSSIIFENGASFNNNSSFLGTASSFIHFIGDGGISGEIIFNKLILSGSTTLGNSVNIQNQLQLNIGAVIKSNAPIFLNGSTLIYNSGNKTIPGLEWSSNQGGPGYPTNIQIGSDKFTTIDLSKGTAPTVLGGRMYITSLGSVILNNILSDFIINGDLIMDPSGKLMLSTSASTRLILNGNWYNKGSFISNKSEVLFSNKLVDQTFYPDQNTSFYSVTIDKNNTTMLIGDTKSNDSIFVSGSLNVRSGTLDFNNKNIVLRADINGTASVTNISGSVKNATHFTAEEYYPASKAWWAIGPPLNTTQTINESWQESQTNTSFVNHNATLGYGTHISGPQNNSGLDFTYRNNPSLKYYDAINDKFILVTNSLTSRLSFQNSYFLFIRGSRAVDLTQNQYAASDPTTLRVFGSLRSGSISFPFNAAIDHSVLIGNPFPCAIDFHLLGRTAGLPDQFTVWDSFLQGVNGVGGFVTYSWDDVSQDYITSVPPSEPRFTRYIQSGQAFLLNCTGNLETLSIPESAKVITPSINTNQIKNKRQELRVNLISQNIDSSYSLSDGTVIVFNDIYDNFKDSRDVIKIKNENENIWTVKNNRSLAIQAKQTIVISDSIHINFNAQPGRHRLTITASNLYITGLIGSLIDSFTGASTSISFDTDNTYDFSVTSDPLSLVADRFKILLIKKDN